MGRLFIAEICLVPSQSMEPSILRGDILIFDKTRYGALLPRRFADIPIINFFTWIPLLRMADYNIDWGYHRVVSRHKPRKNDVIVFYGFEDNIQLTKRICHIAYKGIPQKIGTTQKDNILKMAELDGKSLVYRRDILYINGKHQSTYTPEQNFYYVMGDNRNNSTDSRKFGYIPESAIIGKMGFVLFSWDKDGDIFHKIRWNRIFHSIK